MLVNEGIKIKDFLSKKESQNQKKIIIKFFKKLIKSDNQIVLSMSKDYKNSFKKELILKCKNKRYINIIGIGG